MNEFYIMIGTLVFVLLFFIGMIVFFVRSMRKKMCIIYNDGTRFEILLMQPKEGRVTIDKKEYFVSDVTMAPVKTGILKMFYSAVYIKRDVPKAMSLYKFFAGTKDYTGLTATGLTDIIKANDIKAIHDALSRSRQFGLTNPVFIIGGIMGLLLGVLVGIVIYPSIFPDVAATAVKTVAQPGVIMGLLI